MQQYLLNVTAIWLISLVLFDLLLRRESYHNYNRLYLLGTFLSGILLPLLELKHTNNIYPATIEAPVNKVVQAKQNFTTIVTPVPVNHSIDWMQAITIIYYAGIVFALMLLMIDIIKLVRYYSTGSKSKQDGWIVVASGKSHAPFSFFNLLFISNRGQYTDDEWNIILQHELRHRKLIHFADLMLIQTARILLWFHPLVYFYNKRLLLIHEYQADTVAGNNATIYGKFLVEQYLLQGAPTITHSFNRSTLKNRITMLTRRSSAIAKSRQLIVVPLLLVCILCFTKTGYAQRFERRGDGVFTKGYTFVMSPDKVDSMTYIEPESGRERLQIITMTPMPVKFNGEDIPVETTDKLASFGDPPKSFRSYLLINMVSDLSKLDDGTYTLNVSDILVGKDGKVLYFHYEDMRPGKPGATIAPAFQQELFSKVCALTESAPAFIPGTVGGLPVVSYYEEKDNEFWTKFKVVNHRLYDQNADKEYVPVLGYGEKLHDPIPGSVDLKSKLGNISGTNGTIDQILANPYIIVPGYEVFTFRISFLTNEGDFSGPYVTMGPKLMAEQINYLKDLKTKKIKSVRVFVEEITVYYNDKVTTLKDPVIITCTK